jgi:hypothetical protein
VRLTPLKASIVDKIKAAGDIGLSSEELHNALWERAVTKHTVKAHVWQINELLAETDYRIASDGRGPNARWYLRRPRRERAA